jgi:hypothetical protein
MQYILKKALVFTFLVLTVTISCLSFAAYSEPAVVCPTLTSKEVENVINRGTISTDQGYTLANEAALTPAQVILNEPTANPFDTYYQMHALKQFNGNNYWVYIGNVLGKADYEAKERVKQILLSREKVFNGKYEPSVKVCIYKSINASPAIQNYPFKTRYESIVLLSAPDQAEQKIIQLLTMKKYSS